MGYCTQDDVAKRIPAISADLRAAALISDAIVAAQAEIDGNLKPKFNVPFSTPVPSLVRVIAINLAAGLALEAAFSGGEHLEQIQYADRQQAKARAMIQQILAGTMSLFDVTGTNQLPETVPSCLVSQVTDRINPFLTAHHRRMKSF